MGIKTLSIYAELERVREIQYASEKILVAFQSELQPE